MNETARVIEMATIENQRYKEVMNELVQKMHTLGGTITHTDEQERKVCQSMKDIAIAIGIIGRLSAGNAMLDELTKQLKGCGL